VSADLARTGGSCPHCLLEIPGEEAPTDPGLEAKKRQDAEAAVAVKRARNRSRVTGAVVAVLLAAGGGVAWQRHLAAEEELVYDLGDVYMAPVSKTAAVVADAGAVPVAAVAGKPTGGHKRPDGLGLPDGAATDAALRTTVQEGGSTTATAGSGKVKYVPGSSQAGDVAIASSGGGGLGASDIGSVEIKAERLNTTVLEDDDEIKAMAKEVTAAYWPQIQTCFEQKLKVDESYKGDWRVAFTITTEGAAENVSATALGAADEGLEGCIKRAVGRWHYQRIVHSFKVQRKFSFTASE